MKVVIQRVIQASVTIQQQLHASIGRGMMILVGFKRTIMKKILNG